MGKILVSKGHTNLRILNSLRSALVQEENVVMTIKTISDVHNAP